MRDYTKILDGIREKKTDFDLFNQSGGEAGSDPQEAAATMRAIRVYRQHPEFAGEVRRYIHEKGSGYSEVHSDRTCTRTEGA